MSLQTLSRTSAKPTERVEPSISRETPATATASSIPMPAGRWKTRVLVPGIVIALTGGLLAYSARDALWPVKDVRVVPVVVKATAEVSSGAIVAQAPGWVEADPYSIAVSALTEGIVTEVLALEGQVIQAGDVLARLVDEDAKLALQRAEAELEEARADLATADITLASAQKDWDHPIDRTRTVEVAEAMFKEVEAQLQQLKSQVAVEQAKVSELEEELKRKQQAFDRNAASEFEVVQLKLKLQAQQASLQAMQAQQPVLDAKLTSAAADCKAAMESLSLRIPEARALAEAKSGLAKAKATLQRTQAMRDEAALRLARTEIRSPIAGVVQERLVEPGAKIMFAGDMARSAQVVRLYDPKKLQVRVDVPLSAAAAVGVDQKAEIVVDVLPDRVFKGVVSRVVHEADIQKNTQQVKVSIQDPASELKPEMLARVKFFGRQAKENSSAAETRQRIFIPENLVQRHGDHTMVWVVDGNVAAQRTIKLGTGKLQDSVEVSEGLQPGDRLIVDPVKDGQRVEIASEAAH